MAIGLRNMEEMDTILRLRHPTIVLPATTTYTTLTCSTRARTPALARRPGDMRARVNRVLRIPPYTVPNLRASGRWNVSDRKAGDGTSERAGDGT